MNNLSRLNTKDTDLLKSRYFTLMFGIEIIVPFVKRLKSDSDKGFSG